MRTPGRLIVGLTVLLIGALLMAGNLGLARPRFLLSLFQWWPVLLIVLGLAVLSGLRSRWLNIALLVSLVLMLVLGGLWIGAGPGGLVRSTFDPGAVVPELSALNLRLEMADGHVSTAPPGNQLYQVALEHRAGQATSSFNVSGDTGYARVTTKRGVRLWGGVANPTTAVLAFDGRTPLALDVRVLAGQIHLDLRLYPIRSLVVDCGAGQTTVRLPSLEESLTAKITVRAGEATVWVPRGSGLRVMAGTQLGQQDLSGAGLYRVGEYWQDEAYDLAGARIDLELTATIGKIEVKRY